MRFMSADDMLEAASAACERADSVEYERGHNYATMLLAEAFELKAEYMSAMRLYDEVSAVSNDELLRLGADVGRMEICQRTGSNKLFYDYRNSATNRLLRVEEEVSRMNATQLTLYKELQVRYHLSQIDYYSFVRQTEDVDTERDSVSVLLKGLENDTAMFAYSLYTVDSHCYKLGQGMEAERMSIALDIASRKGYRFIESVALSSLAHALTEHPTVPNKPFLLDVLGVGDCSTDSLAHFMALKAVDVGRDYGSVIAESKGLLFLCEQATDECRYAEALDYAQRVLELANRHHLRNISGDSQSNTEDTLVCYREDKDTISTEMRWIGRGDMSYIPEMMTYVRESLCIIYSGMDKKKESDYNRNIYLDILDATRQDMRMEQRLDNLRAENRSNGIVLVYIIIVALVACVIAYFSGKRFGRLKREQVRIQTQIEGYLNAIIALSPIATGGSVSGYDDSIAAYAEEQKAALTGKAGEKGKKKRAYDGEIVKLIDVLSSWIIHLSENYINLVEKADEISEKKRMHELHISEKRRANVDKAACVSIVNGIAPFLDRALREVEKLADAECVGHESEKLAYVSELVEHINKYNDVLTHWIKMRAGEVSLNVESFNLGEIFDMQGKNRVSYDAKNLTLHIRRTDAVVKADKALTLFMVNTLLENARKYTPEGGRIELYAECEKDYVEVSVKDSGIGLSESDVSMILNSKVYDSRVIGRESVEGGHKLDKGYGFGLMNCKGVIEKYRKVSSLFGVCAFRIESELGHGSRFYFRLPYGKIKSAVCCVLALLSVFSVISCSSGQAEEEQEVEWRPDDPLLFEASDYANKVYYANVDRNHAEAINYADSALMCLNAYYSQKTGRNDRFLVLRGEDQMNEIELWNSEFNTDYHVILDVRNEVAIAALALKDWQLYRYNNEVYTRLYKLLTHDWRLEEYCEKTNLSNANRRTAIIVTLVLLLLGLSVYYVGYYRHIVMFVINMRQLVDFYKRMFAVDTNGTMVDFIMSGVNDIRRVDGVGLAILHNGMKEPEVSFSSRRVDTSLLEQLMVGAISSKTESAFDDGRIRTFLLSITEGSESRVIGAVAIIFHVATVPKEEEMVIRLMLRLVSVNTYYTDVMMDKCKDDIDLLEDDRRKVEKEESDLHIRNMVIDNCLSTFKHETMYYPSRVLQMLDKLQGVTPDAVSWRKCTVDLLELLRYYKGTFALLSENVTRQSGNVNFRRTYVPVADVVGFVAKQVQRFGRKKGISIDFETNEIDSGELVIGDVELLQYLAENIVAALMSVTADGKIRLDFEVSDKFGKFVVTDCRSWHPEVDAKTLFYADTLKIDDSDGRLHGVHYLVCKQIVREHDDRCGTRGCRIYAGQSVETNQFRLVFAIPRAGRRSARGQE